MDIKDAKMGDILYGRKKSLALHPIVFLKQNTKHNFLGAMLTHSPEHGNIELKATHIKVGDANGKKFEFKFQNHFIVNAVLLKKMDWNPFRKIGELTDEGIKFVTDSIGLNNTEPVDYENLPSVQRTIRVKR